MIDCHAHLADSSFDPDRAAVAARAREAGVERVLVVAEDLADARRVLAVCDDHAELLRACVGIHPDRFAEEREPPDAAELDGLAELARAHRERVVAIGEVGLDRWLVKTDERRALQAACLERMAALAAELGVPLNVHSRSAGHHTIDLLAACGARRVLMHAFDGKAGHAQRAFEEHGFLFSIPPSIVRSRQKEKLVAALPLDALCLESDSPVLGPDREARNEPANLTHAVSAIARIKQVDEDRVREATTANARALFDRLD